jgi:3-methyl-2-oxobutanoate hydroxymethyltransferase
LALAGFEELLDFAREKHIPLGCNVESVSLKKEEIEASVHMVHQVATARWSGSRAYQVSDEDAVRNSIRFVKDAEADAVKLEGAGPSLSRVAAIVGAGIPVMGHIGLTPQSATMLGGFKAQGKTAEKARALLDEALALEAAGCFSVVLEAVPAPVAARVSDELEIPTIGIGSGVDCDGQVLVLHDLLGLYSGHAPRFTKRYAEIGTEIQAALERYAGEVRSGAFPEDAHTYAMAEDELAVFLSYSPPRSRTAQ